MYVNINLQRTPSEQGGPLASVKLDENAGFSLRPGDVISFSHPDYDVELRSLRLRVLHKSFDWSHGEGYQPILDLTVEKVE